MKGTITKSLCCAAFFLLPLFAITLVMPRALGQRDRRSFSHKTPEAPSHLDDGTWTITGSLNTGRFLHTATLLPSGFVLVAGGIDAGSITPSAELYDPASETWTVTGDLNTARDAHTANLLPNGKVLVSGGQDSSFTGSSSAELYDPASGSWAATGNLNTGHEFHTATLLANGMVLVTGGFDSGPDISVSAELYDRTNGTWTLTDNLNIARAEHAATLLPNGMVLAAGGFQTSHTSAELYSGPTPPPGCTVTSTTCGRIIVGTAPTDFTVNLSDLADPATVQASDFTVNGTPPDNDNIIN